MAKLPDGYSLVENAPVLPAGFSFVEDTPDLPAGFELLPDTPELLAAESPGVLSRAATAVREAISPIMGETENQRLRREQESAQFSRQFPQVARHVAEQPGTESAVARKEGGLPTAVEQAAFTPAPGTPQIPMIPQQEGTLAQAGAGVVNTLSTVVNMLPTPGGMVAAMGGAPAVAAAVAGAPSMARSVVEGVKTLADPDASVQDKVAAGTGIALVGAGGVAAGRRILGRRMGAGGRVQTIDLELVDDVPAGASRAALAGEVTPAIEAPRELVRIAGRLPELADGSPRPPAQPRVPALPEASMAAGVSSGVSSAGYRPSSQAMGVASGADAWRRVQRVLAPESLLPEEFRQAVRYSDQAQRGIISRAGAIQADLRKSMAGARRSVPDVDAKVMDYLTGQSPITALPPPVRFSAQAARALVDGLSDRAIREGVVSGPLAQTFADNMGTYLRRSYRLFADPDYVPDPGARQAAVDFVRHNWDPKKTLSRMEAETVVAQLLDRPAAAQMMIGGKIAGRDVSSLIKRKDLAPEIRALYGEITDPLEAFGQTVPRMARLVENHAAQQWIRMAGLKQGVFSDTPDPLRHRQLVADSSQPHEVWRGLYTTPEISDAMLREVHTGRAAGLVEGLWRMFRTASGVSKMSKTVLNPDSYAPNFAGGLVTMAANGNFNVLPMGRGLLLGAEELGALRAAGMLPKNRAALQADIQKLTRLGLRGESVSGADLVRTWERSLLPQFTRKTGRVIMPFLKGYGAIDDLTKYMGWKSELARIQRIHPGMALEAAERMAAERVRATMPTYSEIPKWMRELSQLGVAPSFVSFTWEVFRNTANSARIAVRDMAAGARAGNAAQVADGARRLASLLAVVGASTGLGIALLSRRENDITDEQDEAVRFFGTPWNRNAQLVYNTPVKDAQVQFSNSSYLLPHALLTEALEAGLREKTGEEGAKAFLNTFKDQFLSADGGVLIGPLAEAFIGHDRATGRPILNRESMTPTADAFRFVYDRSFDPLVRKKIERVIMAAREEASSSGRVYSLSEEAVRLAGVRAQTIDFNRAVGFKARELGRRFTEASNIYRSVHSTNSPQSVLDAAYEAGERSRQRVFGEVQDYLRLSRAVGVTEERAIKALRASQGLPVDVILGALDGRYVPQARESGESMSAAIERIGQLPAKEAQREALRLATENPAFIRAMMDAGRKRALGITQRDELMLGLSINDGSRAEYIRQKAMEIPDAAERSRYLVDLARKGIINERVVRQVVE